jgi:radical SAM superfamily enzyme YgiQ (UPF0313 family)
MVMRQSYEGERGRRDHTAFFHVSLIFCRDDLARRTTSEVSAMKRVALFEFSFNPAFAPLASAYLQATASHDPRLRDHYTFDKYVLFVNDPRVEQKVAAAEADVYGFSCYVWNMGLVKRLLPALLERRPGAQVILGGPQVMHKADRYIGPAHENVVICNGEGEYTFANYLAQLLEDRPDFAAVQGLSFYRSGELVTTPKQERIRDLDDIPSPYLAGYIDAARFNFAIVETNRGCPFKCTYCYWGAATNAKVNKFDYDRVLEEITWVSRNKFVYLLFTDANFGILERDVEIARHVAACKEKYGFPMEIIFNTSKNTPTRSTAIAKVLNEAGLIVAQPISMQTLSPEALKAVKRNNIKGSAYTEIQTVLNDSAMGSFIELIWPLPGETVESFVEGIDKLCREGAFSFVVYPLVLINNVEMDDQREEYGLVAIEDPDPNSEAQIVISTRDVDNAQYREGMRLTYHLAALYNFYGLRNAMRRLDTTGVSPFGATLTGFAEFCRLNPAHQYSEYVERTGDCDAVYDPNRALGGAVHTALHGAAEEFDDLLLRFMRRFPTWETDEELRLAFDLDLLNRPLIYSNTPIVDKNDVLQLLRVAAVEEDGVIVEIPERYVERVSELLRFPNPHRANRVKITYRNPLLLPFSAGRPIDSFYLYCCYKCRGEVKRILPTWSAVGERSMALA